MVWSKVGLLLIFGNALIRSFTLGGHRKETKLTSSPSTTCSTAVTHCRCDVFALASLFHESNQYCGSVAGHKYVKPPHTNKLESEVAQHVHTVQYTVCNALYICIS